MRRIPPQDLRELRIVIGGFAHFQALAAACELGLFDHLSESGGRTAAEIRRRLKVSAHGARLLLNACCATRLLRRDGRGRYRNGPVAERFLVRRRPLNWVPVVEANRRLLYGSFSHLTDSIRRGTNVGLRAIRGPGQTIYRRLAAHPGLERVFHRWLGAVSEGSNGLLRRVEEFRRVRHVLDVGGGDGTNAIELARLFPHLRITIFDLPSVCRLARRNVTRHGLSDRISFAPGDLFADPFPGGVDAVFFAHVFTIFSEEQNVEILRKCHRALPPDGLVIDLDDMATDEADLDVVRHSLYFLNLATGAGMIHPWEDYEAWYRRAGFREVREYRSAGMNGVIVGVKRPGKQRIGRRRR